MVMSKSLSMAESFSYCITTVPLQSVAIKVDLWQPGIASMKNKLIKQSSAFTNTASKTTA